MQPWATCLHTCSSVTKQYNLVSASGRWCLAAGEVTTALAESNGSPSPASTAKDRDQLWNLCSFWVWDYVLLLSQAVKTSGSKREPLEFDEWGYIYRLDVAQPTVSQRWRLCEECRLQRSFTLPCFTIVELSNVSCESYTSPLTLTRGVYHLVTRCRVLQL